MIIPMVCFTCGCPIAHQWEPYQQLVEHFQIDTERINGGFKQDDSPEYCALAILCVYRECCRRMFICQMDMYDKVS